MIELEEVDTVLKHMKSGKVKDSSEAHEEWQGD